MKHGYGCILLFLCFQIGLSQNKINLFSEINYNSIPSVSLSDYKSVQERDKKYQNPNIALGIGISGGGSRAQFFSMGVLLGLEEIQEANSERNFLNEIDYFSTVSGGCFSAGYYLTILKNKLYQENCSFNEFYFSKADAYKDYVDKSANILSLLNNNRNEKGDRISMTQRIDSDILQYDAVNPDNTNKFNSQMLMSDFFVSKDSKSVPVLPMFVANGTAFNNGERIPFMPHIIRSLNLNSSLAPNKASIALNENEVNDGYNFPVTYAITASSAFPGVLPKVKFGVKDQNKILCIVDGGASDNMGYKTLIELLHDDTKVKEVNKKALFIDCLGQGKKTPYITNAKIRLISLFETASLYTVQTRYMTFDKDVENIFERYKIPITNYQIIGFTTIRDHLLRLEKNQDYEDLVAELKNTNDEPGSWVRLYGNFKQDLIEKFGEDSFKKDKDGEIIVATLSREKFKGLTASQILLLYEYASHVETKLRITPEEREVLLLSGRFAAYLKTDELKALLIENK
ncbi:patatin-like phospholipase family protein [Flavobacterium collinsii]|jgi:predicted acylesterase/phospholipase RssA|uniref:PNPLA domain-containing protein n=3 Tax=Flavobacterium collinsii TaxID=1114861 RepID=A0A9W4TDB6_9FLAO|nr:patatin-like phospholipase family protein [Flavobacterium collinsii]CAI2765887.1 PNPLA domain-containing protein [Flavobacterium collinsii]